MSKSLNEHMYLVVRRYVKLTNNEFSLKHDNEKIDYVMQRGDIIKLGRIKFAVKEISIVEESMEVDEGNQKHLLRHANFEAIDDEEFFEFQDVESFYNTGKQHHSEDDKAKATPTGNTTEGEEVP